MTEIKYWDGETIFLTDTTGTVHTLPESGDPLEITERKWTEANSKWAEDGNA